MSAKPRVRWASVCSITRRSLKNAIWIGSSGAQGSSERWARMGLADWHEAHLNISLFRGTIKGTSGWHSALHSEAPCYEKTRTRICTDRDSGFWAAIGPGAEPRASTLFRLTAIIAGPAPIRHAAASAGPARFPGNAARTKPATIRPAGLRHLHDRSGSECGRGGHR